MKARFTVRRGDTEFPAGSLQDFEALVRSGAISEEDLVHDALTGEWAPARDHPVYQLVMDPLSVELGSTEAPEAHAEEPSDDDGGPDGPEGGAEEAPTADEPPSEVDSVQASDGDEPMDFSMELVEEEERSAEEKAQAFIDRMERERREDSDPILPGGEVEIFDGLSAPTLSLSDPEKGGRRATPPFAASGAGPTSDLGASDGRAGAARGGPSEASDPRPPARGGRRRAWGILGFAVLALGVTAAVAHPAFRFNEMFSRSGGAAEAAAPRSTPPTDAEIRATARVRFLQTVDSMRTASSLDRVPPEWLEGRYLAEASAHPEVGAFWTGYLDYVERVEEEEESLYRDAYLGVLDENGMGGPMRSLRLARATSDFRSAAPERDEAYAAVRELALAAEALHELVLELEDEITWEPARGERLSADPVTEAAARDDPEAQARLDAALDRVLEALYVATGGGRDVLGREPDWLARTLALGGVPEA